MSHNGKGLSALYARDTSEVNKDSVSTSGSSGGERKRSRFDEVGELGRDSRETERKDYTSSKDSRDYGRESKDTRSYTRDIKGDVMSDSRDRYRDDRDRRNNRSSDYERHRGALEDRHEARKDIHETRDDRHESRPDNRHDSRSESRVDERSKRHRDDKDYEKDREYDRYRRERSEKYREHNDRNDRRYESRRPGGNSVEIPFDRFLRLSPWRGPVTPLEERPRHLKNWDVAPAGFERITADKAKLTGLFPPPGNIAKTANYVPPTLDPARAAMFQLLNRETAGVSGSSNISTSSSTPAELSGNLLKQAKRFYVGNLPFNFNESALISFLEANLRGLSGGSNKNVTGDESKILNIAISSDRSYAFVECRTAEDASLAMNLDGVIFEGTQLKVRRPKEYHIALTTGQLSAANSNTNSNQSTSAPTAPAAAQFDNSIINKRQLIISGIPDILTAEHVKSLLLLVADLRNFHLLKDGETDKSLGIAVFEFVEDFEGEEWSGPFLKHSKGNLFMGPFEMKIQRICDLMDNSSEESIRNLLSIYNLQPGFATAPSSTAILQLLNIVTRESLLLDYDSIYQDLSQELTKFSHSTLDLLIPKPSEDNKIIVPGVGKVFIKFGTVEEAARAASELAGRIFDGHTCIVSFYPPEKFDKKIF